MSSLTKCVVGGGVLLWEGNKRKFKADPFTLKRSTNGYFFGFADSGKKRKRGGKLQQYGKQDQGKNERGQYKWKLLTPVTIYLRHHFGTVKVAV